MTPTLQDHIATLRAYQAWRTGADTRTLGGAGIVPADITKALNAVLDFAEDHLRDATKMIGPVKVPSDDELLEWAGQEQFFLFCDEDEFLDIARALLAKNNHQNAYIQGFHDGVKAAGDVIKKIEQETK